MGCILKENCLFLSQKQSIINNCSPRHGTSCPFPLCMLKLSLAWAFKDLMNNFFPPVNSYTKLLPFSHWLPMGLIVFLSPLLQRSLCLQRSVCDIDARIRAEFSMVSYCLHFDRLWDFVKCSVLEKEAFLTRVEICTNLWVWV